METKTERNYRHLFNKMYNSEMDLELKMSYSLRVVYKNGLQYEFNTIIKGGNKIK